MTQERIGQPALYCTAALLPDGWARDVRIEVAGGRIAAVECDAAPRVGDERVALALPGAGNLHSHAFQRAMAGLTERRGPGQDSFWTWRDLMYRFAAKITPDDIEAIAAMAYIEMLEAGFTRVGEFHYIHHGPGGSRYDDLGEMAARIAAAADSAGIGLTLLPVFYAHSGFGGAPPMAEQARFVNDVERYARLIERSRVAVSSLDGAVVGIAPHSLRAVTPDELNAILPLADDKPIHIHIAEQLKEVSDCRDWSAKRPIEWLLDAVPVDSRWCLVHATHMTEHETARLAESGAVAGLCPITEANLGDGIFPAGDFQAAGGMFGIGSDSNVRIDLGDELRLLEYGQRLQAKARNVLAADDGRSTGRTLFDTTVQGGAQALGVDTGLREGAPADIVALDVDHPAFASRTGDALLDSFIFAGGSGIADVWRGGRKVVSQGRHVGRQRVARDYRKALDRLLA